jgi:hypothetical protein
MGQISEDTYLIVASNICINNNKIKGMPITVAGIKEVMKELKKGIEWTQNE